MGTCPPYGLAALIDPPLTTVATPHEMGLEAMKMLQRLIAGRDRRSGRRRATDKAGHTTKSCGAHDSPSVAADPVIVGSARVADDVMRRARNAPLTPEKHGRCTL